MLGIDVSGVVAEIYAVGLILQIAIALCIMSVCVAYIRSALQGNDSAKIKKDVRETLSTAWIGGYLFVAVAMAVILPRLITP